MKIEIIHDERITKETDKVCIHMVIIIPYVGHGGLTTAVIFYVLLEYGRGKRKFELDNLEQPFA